MSTPTNRQAEKEHKPGAKHNQSAAKGQSAASKRAPTTPQNALAGQKPAQQEAATKAASTPEEKAKAPQSNNAAAAGRDERLEQRRADIQARQQERRRELQAATSPAPRPATQPDARTTPAPAPKPRDPSVARRDERREQRRADIQARQQERRRELQQAKRQKLGIRYSIVVAAVLFIGLVSFFSFEHAWLATGISAAAVLLVELAILTFMTLAKPKRAGYRSRSGSTPARSTAAGEDIPEAAGLPQEAPEDTPAQETAERGS